jgi:hypothetical protein
MATVRIDQSLGERSAPRAAVLPRIGVSARVMAFVAATVTLVAVTLSIALPSILSPKVVYSPTSAATKAFEASTGLRLIRVAPTGDNGLVEVQYQIVNPSNAGNLLGPTHDIYPTLVDEASGRPIVEAFMGHAPHPVFRMGATAFDILTDPGHIVRAGSLVTVVVGKYRLEHIPVSAP